MDEDLDPDLADEIDRIDGLGLPAWHQMGVAEARRVEDDLFSPEDPPPVASVRELTVEGPAGPLPVRCYRDTDGPAPVVVFFHGGGFVMGTLDSADDLCRELARRTGAVVCSVDYRLAPEHPFPAAVEDAVAAARWAGTADAPGPDHGGDPERLHVAGTSAGGCLAAAVARALSGEDGPTVAAQHLLYPMLDASWGNDPDLEPGGPLLSGADLSWFWEQYLPDPDDAGDPLATPLAAEDLAGLPPATVATAGHDPLHREGATYAERLSTAGVDVDHLHYPELSHGFLSFSDVVPACDRAFEAVAAGIG